MKATTAAKNISADINENVRQIEEKTKTSLLWT